MDECLANFDKGSGSARVRFARFELAQNPAHHGDAQRQRADIRDGLADLDAEQTEDAREDQQRRDEEDALTRGGDDRGAHAVADGLREHVAHGDIAPERQGQKLEAQGEGADFDDLRIVAAEQGDDLAGERQGDDAKHDQNDGHDLHAEPEGLAHAPELARAVGEAADRLEALSESDHGGADEHHIPAHDGESRDRRIPEWVCRKVQRSSRNARDPLTAEGRDPAVKDLTVEG